MAGNYEISRKTIFVLIFIILIVLGFIGYSSYAQTQETNEHLEEYKRTVYDSLVCQYSCDLIEGESNGQQTMVPDTTCIQGCLAQVREKGFTGEEFSDAEILSDDLFLDIDTVIQDCKSEHFVADDVNTIPDFSAFHSCVIDGFASLKEDYSYLA